MKDRWELSKTGIIWNVKGDSQLPHYDKMEISGSQSSVLLYYGAEADGSLSLRQEVVYPLFRKFPNDTHASLQQEYREEMGLPFLMNGKAAEKEFVEKIEYDGMFTVYSRSRDLQITRKIFPASSATEAYQEIVLKNDGAEELTVQTTDGWQEKYHKGACGIYATGALAAEKADTVLAPGQEYRIFIRYYARNVWEQLKDADNCTCEKEKEARIAFCNEIKKQLVLETPDELLNREFYFTKIRAAESIFDTRLGKVHSPGGGNFYAAIWTNDQAEYAGPFFALLGNENGLEASLNCYRLFARFMSPDYTFLPTSIIPEADTIWEGAGDRGDAAMYMYGCCRFLLLHGNKEWIKELWPAVKWCAEYCRKKTGEDGVIHSDSDELENRFESGAANLCTSATAYGGYLLAAKIAKELGEDGYAAELQTRAEKLRAAIEAYFGRNVQGFNTYQYYDGNEKLRSWICIPLTVGIDERKEETLRAMFSEYLWTEDGMKTEVGDKTFWDRSTLYGLKGGFQAGAAQDTISRFRNYTRKRLLGEHVPYPVEAYPEGAQRHLSGESALYCRVVLDGMFGIEPAFASGIYCTPSFPEKWSRVSLKNISHCGCTYSLFYQKDGDGCTIKYVNHTTGTEKEYPVCKDEKILIELV